MRPVQIMYAEKVLPPLHNVSASVVISIKLKVSDFHESQQVMRDLQTLTDTFYYCNLIITYSLEIFLSVFSAKQS